MFGDLSSLAGGLIPVITSQSAYTRGSQKLQLKAYELNNAHAVLKPQ
jgi:hypothetical protein